jgi:predicted nucleic acid-binding protein
VVSSDAGVVMDASAAIALVASEPQGQAVHTLLSHWNAEDRPVLVSAFFWLEVVNSLMRRHSWSGADALAAIHKLDTFELATVEQDRALVISALDLAERHVLTAYDAAYLALAIRLDTQLLTLDRRLALAAGARAVSIGDQRVSDEGAPYEREATWPSYRGASAYLAKLRAQAAR